MSERQRGGLDDYQTYMLVPGYDLLRYQVTALRMGAEVNVLPIRTDAGTRTAVADVQKAIAAFVAARVERQQQSSPGTPIDVLEMSVSAARALQDGACIVQVIADSYERWEQLCAKVETYGGE